MSSFLQKRNRFTTQLLVATRLDCLLIGAYRASITVRIIPSHIRNLTALTPTTDEIDPSAKVMVPPDTSRKESS
jgi:hypothetical protein